ncbi:lanthionine synthetase LanC family protein [Chryseobacterium tongliaoense]|uniref:lanthionine synthetase LanC family protein n=1 Tax=Chryseobacterium tongliaoense TaxID=3240933 RepID=UPI003519B83E
MKSSSLLKKIESIHTNIQNNYSQSPDIGVLTGISGYSLFLEYYKSSINQSENHFIDTEKLFNICIEKINAGYEMPTYCDGINGFMWTLLFLQNNNFLENSENGILDILDKYIGEWVEVTIQKNNFDFLHGSAGYLSYFINRIKHVEGNQKKDIEALIKLFIKGLSSRIKEITDYRLLKTDQDFKNRTYLGLAHGISGIILILSKLSLIHPFKNESLALLKNYTSFLTDTQNISQNKVSYFPSWLTQSTNIHNTQSALSWCAGDLGIGIALLNTAQNIHDISIKNQAIEILEHSAKRITKEQSFLESPGMCHGFFGAYKIFSRAYSLTGEKIFSTAKEYWLKKGLESINNNIPSDLSILNGQAGIGLALIDAYTDIDHNWGECLLIS